MKRIVAILGIAGTLALVGGAVPAGASPVRAAHARSVGGTSRTVTIVFFAFHPNNFFVRPGTTITVDNHDWTSIQEPHTFTGAGLVFNTGVITGTPKSVTAPTVPGKYVFFCAIHPFMFGTLYVQSP